MLFEHCRLRPGIVCVLSNDGAEPQVFDERIKVPIVMEEFIIAFNTTSSDYAIDCFANGYTYLAQGSKVPRRLNCDPLATQIHDLQ